MLDHVHILRRGDAIPHFEVRTIDGEPFSYASIWQRKHLVLVALPPLESEATSEYVSDLTGRLRELGDEDVETVVTRESVSGVPRSSVLVADRWGEIVFEQSGDLPPAQELVDWLIFVKNRCPECEGEAR